MKRNAIAAQADVPSPKEEIQKNVHDYHVFAVLGIFMVAFLLFFSIPEANLPILRDVYIEMAIFLFATVTGFSVARQNSRYRQIMEEVASFDGGVSAIYRELFYFSKKSQKDFEKIARRHYQPIITNHQWDYNIINKSSTLSDTYLLLEKAVKDPTFDFGDGSSLASVKKLLADMQKNRKDMISLHSERVPKFQWFVIVFLSFILVMTVTAIPSYGAFIESIIKASFATAIVTTVVMLRRLDDLQLFESFLGEHSAEDIINIFDGKK